jgi:RNA polymerase sigma-70 factor, ECF subfamily
MSRSEAVNGKPAGEITLLLQRWADGQAEAADELFEALYPELRRLADSRMRSERADHTLQPTALVNEFFLRIARQKHFAWRNRAHFLAVASRAMRRLLIDYARARNSDKRGSGAILLNLQDFAASVQVHHVDALEFDELLQRLAAEEPRMAQVTEMRCFGGLTNAEIGEALGIDERTVKRDWEVARAWLRGKLSKREK